MALPRGWLSAGRGLLLTTEPKGLVVSAKRVKGDEYFKSVCTSTATKRGWSDKVKNRSSDTSQNLSPRATCTQIRFLLRMPVAWELC